MLISTSSSPTPPPSLQERLVERASRTVEEYSDGVRRDIQLEVDKAMKKLEELFSGLDFTRDSVEGNMEDELFEELEQILKEERSKTKKNNM